MCVDATLIGSEFNGTVLLPLGHRGLVCRVGYEGEHFRGVLSSRHHGWADEIRDDVVKNTKPHTPSDVIYI